MIRLKKIMEVKNKVLVVGRSKGLSQVFNFYFNNTITESISFRKAWENLDTIKESETIVLSGFHFNICSISLLDVDKYIDEYINFLINIKKKCNNLYLICTDLNIPFSTSRVVYFYYNLLKKLKFNNDYKIISLQTVYNEEKSFFKKLKIRILKFIISNLINLNNLDKDIESYRIKTLNEINFFFIFIPRTRALDRVIRLFFDLILIKKIMNK